MHRIEGKFKNQNEIAKDLINQSDFLKQSTISEDAERVISYCRNNKNQRSMMDAFMEEYGLSNQEGIALMCLAESLIRIPDDDTRNELINEKLTSSKWSEHLNQSDSFLVNSATWGLLIAKKFLQFSPTGSDNWLINLSKKVGEAPIREAIQIAMKILGKEFVCGKSIKDIDKSQIIQSHICSFDMLGEAARTNQQSEQYYNAYLEAIITTGILNKKNNTSHGISIKLSALHPKYNALHEQDVRKILFPRIKTLINAAMEHDVEITIDAEEQDRLSLSLQIFEELSLQKDIKSWPKLGIALQAYGKRAIQVINSLNKWLGKRDKIHVRLVKGAYWDYEIKNAQLNGYQDYSVFTNKSLTDLNYLVSAKHLIDSPKIIPYFASHNAYTISAIMKMAGSNQFEFQRLFGMGELLFKACNEIFKDFNNTRVYCPVGEHKDLLPYLVRRLLENGANSSFVNQIFNEKIGVDQLSNNPVNIIKEKIEQNKLSKLKLPNEIFLPRINSRGFDLTEPDSIKHLRNEINRCAEINFKASGSLQNSKSKDILKTVNELGTKNKIGEVRFDHSKEIETINVLPSKEWSNSSIDHRSGVLNQVADDIEQNPEKFLYLLINEAGKTIQDACDEIRETVDLIRYYALEVKKYDVQHEMPGPTGEKNFLSFQPKGLVLCISPWNFPLAITLGQIMASLVTGNSVIAKPSEHTSIIASEAINLLHKNGIPKNALTLILGKGDVAKSIIKSQNIDLVVFTGSIKTARNIQITLAKKDGKIVPLIAETGGLNAMVIDSSALLEQACDDVIRSAFNSSGQRCSALRLLLVDKVIDAELTMMLQGAMDELNVGKPSENSTDMGPIINRQALIKLNKYVASQKSCGLEVYQSMMSPKLKSYWMPPTMIKIKNINDLNSEEFGPILHVLSYNQKNLSAYLSQLKDKGFGLTFGVHSRIESKALNTAEIIAAGNTYINRDMIGAAVESQPFGGIGLSGSGFKAGGPNYLIQFLNETATSVNTVAIGGNAELLNLESFDGDPKKNK